VLEKESKSAGAYPLDPALKGSHPGVSKLSPKLWLEPLSAISIHLLIVQTTSKSFHLIFQKRTIFDQPDSRSARECTGEMPPTPQTSYSRRFSSKGPGARRDPNDRNEYC